MDSDSSRATQQQVRQNVPKTSRLQIPNIPKFPLSSPIIDEVLTPCPDSDSPEHSTGRIENPFLSPEDHLIPETNNFEDQDALQRWSSGWNSTQHFGGTNLNRTVDDNPIKKTRPGLNLVTNFTADEFQQAVKDSIARSRQAPVKGFLDLNDLKSLSKSKQSHDLQDHKPQSTWRSKARGYQELKDQATDSHKAFPQSGHVEKKSLMRMVSRRAGPKSSRRAQDLSPSDRPILIGMSVPAVNGNHAVEEEPIAQKNQQTPVTPSIVITPAIEDRNWDTVWNSSTQQPRPASSVYSQPTPFMKPSRIESIPPVPAIPVMDSSWNNEKYSEPLVDRSPGWTRKRRSCSAGTVFEEEISPSWRSMRGRSFSNENRRETPKRLSLETMSPQRRSQGWWNVLLSPLVSRSSTISSCRSPAVEDSSPPPVPSLTEMPNASYSGNTTNEKSYGTEILSFPPESADSKNWNRTQSNITAWPNMDDWDKQREDRNMAPQSFHSPKPPCEASPMSASSTQSVPLVMSTVANQVDISHNMPCKHDLLSNQPCSMCLTRSNIDRFLAETAANSRGISAACPGQFTFSQDQATQQRLENPCFQRFVANLTDDGMGRTRSDSGSTTIEDDEPEMSPNIRQATATPLFRAGGATPALVYPPVRPRSPETSSKVEVGEPSNSLGTRKLSRSTSSTKWRTSESILPPYSSPNPNKPIPRYRAIFPPGQEPHSPGPISPEGNNAMAIRGGIPMANIENIQPPPAIYNPSISTFESNNRLPPRPPAAPIDLFSIHGPAVVRTKIESKRRRREKEDKLGKNVGGLWRGRGCFSSAGCFGRGGREGRKRRRWYFAIAVLLLLIIIASIVLAVMLTKKKANPPDIQSRWLNLSGYPAVPTGISTVGGPDPIEARSGCVHPSTLWSCALPKEDQAMNAPYDADVPKFRIQITFKNGTYSRSTRVTGKAKRDVELDLHKYSIRRILGYNSLYSRSDNLTPVPAPPNLKDLEFLGNTTDGTSSPFIGEETPFYATFLSTGTLNNHGKRDSFPNPLPNLTDIIPSPSSASDGTAAPANLLPFPTNQPLRLFDRGMATEHYGFYTYYDRSIFLKSVAPLKGSDASDIPDDKEGGSTKSAARVRCTWAETRFLVQIWTQPEKARLQLVEASASFNASTSSARSSSAPPDYAADFSRPGTFPYPVTIKLDRHGGDAKKKMIYCYGMNERSQIELNEKKLQLEFRGYAGTLINPAAGIFNLTSSGKSKRDEGWQPIDGGTGGYFPLFKNLDLASLKRPRMHLRPAPSSPSLLNPGGYDDDAASLRSISDQDSDSEDDQFVQASRSTLELARHDQTVLEEEEELERLLTRNTNPTGGLKKIFGVAHDTGSSVRIGKRGKKRRRKKRRTQPHTNRGGDEEGELMYEMEEGDAFNKEEDDESSSLSSSSSSSSLDTLALGNQTYKQRFRRRFSLSFAAITVFFLILFLGAYKASSQFRAKQHNRYALLSNGTALFRPTTIVVSLDGFRADFLTRGLTPTLNQFIAQGISPPYMLPSFPSVTFPNHFTLVTGLYPESHGVVGNTFWDPKLREDFYYTDPTRSMQAKWWNAEPIWATAEKQGVRTAIHMWPGSEAHIGPLEPTYLDKYNGSEKLPIKVDRILHWLDLPGDDDDEYRSAKGQKRPQFIASYVPNVDSDGHKFGPNSTEIKQTIANADAMLKSLFVGLQDRNLTHIVNVVVVSDHGMATTSTDRLIQLDDLIDLNLIERIDGWPLQGLRPARESDIPRIMSELGSSSKPYKDSIEIYTRENMPERYHFSKSDRIAPIWIIPKTGWAIVKKADFNVEEAKKKNVTYHPRGIHGYDHEHPLMRSIFVARGPSFPHKPNSRVNVFQNTEVYNIICDTLHIKPNPNNGTLHLPLQPVGLHSDEDAPAPEVPDDPPVSSSTSTSTSIITGSATGVWTRPAPVHTTSPSVTTTVPGDSHGIEGGQGQEDKKDGENEEHEKHMLSWWKYIKERIDALKKWAKGLLEDERSNTVPDPDIS
ncbi:hypothetical protein PRK78_004083 [Emydomyces testavorans]|uniref:Uncharacterized protein n=1 Tax=Emydomyces testavorans TaxID=2070801 RepID=A0AAF0IIA1_9EURO|nr:hypothetical protein PRK78_004083 [Emydomyces testavorans]